MIICGIFGCEKSATHWLLQPDGKRNPGGWVCEKHGKEIVAEYREKLGEEWSIENITERKDR